MRGALLLLLTLPLIGQQPFPAGSADCSPASIERGLASDSKRDVAWAAWCAGVDESQGSRWSQPLRDALRTAISLPQQDQNKFLTLVLIDAVLRSKTVIQVQEAAAIYDSYPDAAVALIAGVYGDAAKDSRGILEVLRREEPQNNRARWLALAAPLYWSQDLKRYLAEEVRFEYSINVVDDNDVRPTRESIGLGVPGGVGGGVSSADWPPRSTYCLTLSSKSGDEALTTTIANVFVRRTSYPFPCDTGNWKDHPKDVIRILYSFAHCSTCQYNGPRTRDYPDILGGRAGIEWRSVGQVDASLARVAASYIQECRAFMAALGEGDWSAERILQMVTITVSDQRVNKTEPIPNLDLERLAKSLK